MISIAIVDDDDADARCAADMIDRYYEGDRSKYRITRFADGETFLDDYQAEFDAMFLDVEMPGIDGLETARRLREIDDHVVLVFTTKMAQYAAVGYDVDAVGYLVKPLEYYGFALKMRKVEALAEKRRGITVALMIDGEAHFLSSHDIQYVEVRDHELLYRTQGGAYKVWGSLKDAATQLASARFEPANRYCLVNLEWVTAVEDGMVIVGGRSLPISRARKKPLLQALAGFYGGRR